jgi:hypothetical protein
MFLLNMTSHQKDLSEPALFPKEVIYDAASKLDKTKAVGLDGTPNAALREIVSVDDLCAYEFASLINNICAGNVPTEAVQVLCVSLGMGLPKGDGSTRPISIVGTIVRLAASLVARKATVACAPALVSAGQLGIGVLRGCELAIKTVERAVSDGSLPLTDEDEAVAFQNMERSMMFKGLVDCGGSCALRLANMLYGVETNIHVLLQQSDGFDEIVSSVGSKQGCPLGTLLYGCGSRKGLEEHIRKYPSGVIVAIVDDVKRVIALPLLTEAHMHWRLTVRARGGDLKESKCAVYAPGFSMDQLLSAGVPASMAAQRPIRTAQPWRRHW